jgi:hypothetical protein
MVLLSPPATDCLARRSSCSLRVRAPVVRRKAVASRVIGVSSRLRTLAQSGPRFNRYWKGIPEARVRHVIRSNLITSMLQRSCRPIPQGASAIVGSRIAPDAGWVSSRIRAHYPVVDVTSVCIQSPLPKLNDRYGDVTPITSSRG